MESVMQILNSLSLGGLAIFIYFTFKGLRTEVKTLRTTVQEQNRTLQAARERANELDRMREIYRKALYEYKEMGDIIGERRRKLVSELEDAVRRKDEELAEVKRLELERINDALKERKKIPEKKIPERSKLLVEAAQVAMMEEGKQESWIRATLEGEEEAWGEEMMIAEEEGWPYVLPDLASEEVREARLRAIIEAGAMLSAILSERGDPERQ